MAFLYPSLHCPVFAVTARSVYRVGARVWICVATSLTGRCGTHKTRERTNDNRQRRPPHSDTVSCEERTVAWRTDSAEVGVPTAQHDGATARARLTVSPYAATGGVRYYEPCQRLAAIRGERGGGGERERRLYGVCVCVCVRVRSRMVYVCLCV